MAAAVTTPPATRDIGDSAGAGAGDVIQGHVVVGAVGERAGWRCRDREGRYHARRLANRDIARRGDLSEQRPARQHRELLSERVVLGDQVLEAGDELIRLVTSRRTPAAETDCRRTG